MRVHTILLIFIYTSIVYYEDHACIHLRVRYFGFQDTQNTYLESRTQSDSLENGSIVIV